MSQPFSSPALRLAGHVTLSMALVASMAACTSSTGGGGQSGCDSEHTVCANVALDRWIAEADLRINGSVAEVTGGDASDTCTPTTIRVTEEGTGAEWAVKLAISGFVLPLSAGDPITIDYASRGGDITPPSESITLSSAGSLVVYFAFDAGWKVPLPEGLSVADADLLCSRGDEFGEWEQHALNVTIDGATVRMVPGDSKVVSGYHFVLRSNTTDNGSSDSGDDRTFAMWPAR